MVGLKPSTVSDEVNTGVQLDFPQLDFPRLENEDTIV